MNPGKLNRWIEITEYANGEYTKLRNAYCAYKYKNNVILSRHAVSKPGAEITIRRFGISKSNGIRFAKKNLLIASIDDTDSDYVTLRCAEVEIVKGKAVRITTGVDSLNRPENKVVSLPDFEGVLTEKYIGHQQNVNAVLTYSMLLITHKTVKLKTGDTVIFAEEDEYTVIVAYTDDNYYNEYEMIRICDA